MKTKKRISKDTLEKAAYILKAISHPCRLAIIELLSTYDEMTVTAITSELNEEQSAISHHLSNLRLRGLLKQRKDGASIYYSLKEKNLTKIIECVATCNCTM
jgi:ArsR family transcriptional regulator